MSPCWRQEYESLSIHPALYTPKNFAVDDVYGTVGSVNLDYRSMFLHFEDGVWLCHDPSVMDIKADFLTTQDKSMEITLAQCRSRSWPRRLLAGFAAYCCAASVG